MTDVSMNDIAPRPWTVEDSPWGFVYLKDANGKRFAAMYGTNAKRFATACFIVGEAGKE